MRITSIQDKKLHVIEQLIKINDEDLFNQIQALITEHTPAFKKISKKELVSRAQLANSDIEKGNIYTQQQVEELSKKW